ncbi:MAG: Maf family protein, partial [Bryobacterales bacterium]|nr:Maf family protein [Bryobacteraceae bacterium]MDW8130079.1 Maf family protein [Bryobacterales bacterium]
KVMLILASQSPRRRELLQRAGFDFTVRPAGIDETWREGEDPESHVLRLAREKARAAPASETDIVLGADTVVVVDGEILGKPSDGEDAARMLRLLSGRDHCVLTGVCLKRGDLELVEAERTLVRFLALSEEEIREYIASGEPMDKAGAYAIQGLASKFVERIEGCYFNVVGLPVARVYRMLKRLRTLAGGV